MQRKKMGTGLSRKEFLKLGGAGLAGAALLGTAGCGGSSSSSGDLVFSWGPDDTGSLPKLVDKFNKQSKDFKVRYQEMPVDTGQYFDKLRTQFQTGGGGIDVILGSGLQPAAARRFAPCQHASLVSTLPSVAFSTPASQACQPFCRAGPLGRARGTAADGGRGRRSRRRPETTP